MVADERVRQAEREAVTANIDRMIQQFDWRRSRGRAGVSPVVTPSSAGAAIIDLEEWRQRRSQAKEN